MDVGREDGCHLPPLYIRHAVVRMQHKYFDLCASGNGINRGRPGIARGCSDDCQFLVRTRKKAFEKLAKQLQRNILERQGRAVKKLKQPMLAIQLHQWGNGLMGEGAISCGAQALELCLVQYTCGKRRHDTRGKIDIRQPAHRGDFFC